ncbi:ABC transporter permease [Nocardiopsis sp. ATB16-24]|uniref:ABC transporter permease n=1 Tax=Nocardiopsis sp. ATB16-24 TaxID=3019555 RepID=UPI002556C22A|nr:ABC transporter permease [Nocardiopsis sp. ATB16-24]
MNTTPTRPTAQVRAVVMVWRREVTVFLRTRTCLLLGLAQPLLVLLALNTNTSRYAPATDSAVFLFSGALAVAVLAPAFTAGTSYLRDHTFGLLQQMLLAPVPRACLLLGKTLAGTTIATCHSALLLLLTTTAGLPYEPMLLARLMVVLALSSFAMTSLAVLLAVCLPHPRAFHTTTALLAGPMVALSGAFSPSGELPSWLASLSALNPLTHTVDAARATITAHLPSTPDSLTATVRTTGAGPSCAEELTVLMCCGALCLFLALRRFAGADHHPTAKSTTPPPLSQPPGL